MLLETGETQPDAAASGGKARPFTGAVTVFSVMTIWGALSALAATNGLYQSIDGRPPYGLVAAAVSPPLFFCLAHWRSRTVQQWVRQVDLGLITAMQGWRVVGAAFVFLWGLDMLPSAFAVPAGFGDIAVGLFAPFVAISVWRRAKGWKRWSYALITIGLLDFLTAFATGAMARDGGALHLPDMIHTGLLAEVPMALIPGYLVPAFAILHIIALIKLRHEDTGGNP